MAVSSEREPRTDSRYSGTPPSSSCSQFRPSREFTSNRIPYGGPDHVNIRNSKLVPYYYLGRGSFSQLSGLLASRRSEGGGSHAVIVIDHFFRDKSLLDLGFLETQDVVIYADTTDEPTTSYVDKLADHVRTAGILPVAVVGIGGGSTLDIAKALSVLLTNAGPAEAYQGWDLPQNPAIYKIGIPTIAGTGAEFTRTAVLTGPVKKLGINSDFSVFDQVILDADLLKTVPKEQFIYTAMDCFVHNEESLLGRMNDAMTIALAEKSLEMMKDIFLGKMDEERLLIASSLGGIAVANSSVGICHPFSYGLSLVLGLHHGFAITIAFNQLGEYYPNVSVFRDILRRHDVVLPKVVTAEVTEEQLDVMAEATLKNERPLSNAFGDNWRSVFSKEKVKSILRRM